MTGLSPSAMVPLFYGADKDKLKQFGFADDIRLFNKDTETRRNLFEPVVNVEAEIYVGQGRSPEQQCATRKMLQQLAIHMMNCSWPGASDDDNGKIPAGYTYLAQLAAHDLVSNIAPLPRLGDAHGYFARDYRTDRLVLDTIYGGGPATTLLPFELPARLRSQRHRLRLGHVPPAESEMDPLPPMMKQPPRDIGRAACPFLSDDDPDRPIVGFPDALLADPRNDDHVIVSQLTALFHELHNIVDRKLEGPGERPGDVDDFVMYRRFLNARKIVATAYRSVLMNDLLRRLLEPGVYDYYKADKYSPFLDKDDGRVPVEFSHAVYRIGHVMTRPGYVLNDKLSNEQSMYEILDHSSARNARRTPIACTWLVDWSRFFDLGDKAKLNFSRAIRPHVGLAGLAGNLPFDNEDRAEGGIFYRDLIRGADAGVRTVDSLIKHLRRQDVERSRLLHDRGYRQHEICKWLTQCRGPYMHAFCTADRFSLTENPPLLFFVLFEAALTQNGERLGIIGSVVVAEAFFNAYRRTSATIEGDGDDIYQASLRKVFPTGVPSDMPALIHFVKNQGGLSDINCTI